MNIVQIENNYFGYVHNKETKIISKIVYNSFTELIKLEHITNIINSFGNQFRLHLPQDFYIKVFQNKERRICYEHLVKQIAHISKIQKDDDYVFSPETFDKVTYIKNLII